MVSFSCFGCPTVFFVVYSCVTWSAYHRNVLASADYEGTITLWDAFTGQKSKLFQVKQFSYNKYAKSFQIRARLFKTNDIVS